MIKNLSWIVFFFLGQTALANPEIKVPEWFKQHYKNINAETFTLENGVEVYLRSDPRFVDTTVYFEIEVGGLDDPQGQSGITHLLEHVVFESDDPEHPGFFELMDEIGADANAFTYPDKTVIYASGHWQDAPEIIRQMTQIVSNFNAPQDAFEIERSRIFEEFNQELDEDVTIEMAIEDYLHQANHPAHWYLSGVEETLGPKKVTLQTLRSHFERFYRSEAMKVLVMTDQPTENLKPLLTESLRSIPHKHFTKRKLPKPFADNFLPKAASFESQEGVNSTLVNFYFDQNHNPEDTKPMTLIGYLLGQEEKGSITEILRSRSLVSASMVDTLESSNVNKLFMELVLTEEGHQRRHEVLEIITQYLEYLKTQPFPKEIWKQISLSNARSFLFPSSIDGLKTAEIISNAMEINSPGNPLEKALLLWNEEQAAEDYFIALNHLSIEKMLVIHRQSTPLQMTESSKSESIITLPHYDRQYLLQDLSKDDLLNQKSQSTKNKEDFRIPKPSSYFRDYYSHPKSADSKPSLLIQRPWGNLWYQNDHRHLNLDGMIKTFINVPVCNHSIENQLYCKLFVTALNEHLRDIIDEMHNAEIDLQIYSGNGKITVSITGLGVDLADFSGEMIPRILNFSPTLEDLENAKQKLFKSFKNRIAKRSPISLAKNSLKKVKGDHFSDEDYLESLKNIQIPEFSDWSKSLWQEITLEQYASGNLNLEDLKENFLLWHYQGVDLLGEIDRHLQNDMNNLKLQPGASYYSKERTYKSQNAYRNFMTTGKASLEDSVLTNLAGAILGGLFDQEVGTIEGMGYQVELFASPSPFGRQTGLVLQAQSSEKTPEEIASIFEEWKVKTYLSISKITKDKLPIFRANFLRDLHLRTNDIEVDLTLLKTAVSCFRNGDIPCYDIKKRTQEILLDPNLELKVRKFLKALLKDTKNVQLHGLIYKDDIEEKHIPGLDLGHKIPPLQTIVK